MRRDGAKERGGERTTISPRPARPPVGPVILAVGLALSAALPASAAPRVTLKLEGTTLHVTLRELQRQTGMQFRSQDGAGEDNFKEPAIAKKARFEWKAAPLGKVVRDVCAAYGLTSSAMGDSGFWFQPGQIQKRREVSREGIAFSLPSVTQTESHQIIPGQGEPRVQRSLSMRLVFRAESGDGDIIGPLTRLSLTDEAGRTVEVPTQRINEGGYGLPDERTRSTSVPWTGAMPRKLRRLEGEVALFEKVEEHRFSHPIQAVGQLPPTQSGTVRMQVSRIVREGRQTTVAYQLTWPKETEIALYGSAAVRTLLRWENGRVERVYPSSQLSTQDGQNIARLEVRAGYETPPTQVEVLVPSRTTSGRKVSFVMENVTLPFGRPFAPRLEPLAMKPRVTRYFRRSAGGVPGSLYDREGGAVLVPAPRSMADTETPIQALLGLSRKQPDGTWSASRWVAVDMDASGEEGSARLPYLAAGTYQVRLQYWQRASEGRTAQRLPSPERSFTLNIQPGQDVALGR